MPMLADLHTHTIYSDGKLTPFEIIKKGETLGLDYLAITDHDTVDAALIACNIKSKVKVIFGLELTTASNGENVHVLAYFKEPLTSGSLILYLTELKRKRKERAYQMLKLLQEHYNIVLDPRFIAEKHSVTRGTFYKEIRAKYKLSANDAKKLLQEDSKAYVPVPALKTDEALKLIHENKGIAILAHPCLLKKNDVGGLLSLGFDGLEGWYKNPLNDVLKYKKIARKMNLLLTGGSDFHYSGDDYHAELGEVALSGDDLERFLAKVYG